MELLPFSDITVGIDDFPVRAARRLLAVLELFGESID